MKTPRRQAAAPPSATSLPLAPADDAGTRMRNYLVTMAVRIACLVLMVFVTPYGWYSFVFAAGAVFLPYIAVVIANAASGRRVTVAEHPEQSIAAAPASEAPREPEATPPTIIRIAETPSAPADTPSADAPSTDPGTAEPGAPGDRT